MSTSTGTTPGALTGGTVSLPVLGPETVISGYYDLKNKKINGIKYDHVGTRSGLGSMLDSELIQKNLKEQQSLLGPGYVKLARIDARGNVIKENSTINLNGRLVTSDQNGSFLIVDSKALDKVRQRELERSNYLESRVSDCAVSDELCAMTCGKSVADLENDLKPNGAFKEFNGRALEPALHGVDATPSAIATYAEESITRSNAIRKLKMYVETIFPIVDELTSEKTTVEGDEVRK